MLVPYCWRISSPSFPFSASKISNSSPSISERSMRFISESSIIRIFCPPFLPVSLSSVQILDCSVTTLFFVIFAWYIYLSARRIASSIFSPFDKIPPTLTERRSCEYPGTAAVWTLSWIWRSLISKASPLISGNKSKNSSPPYLMSISLLRIFFFMICTTVSNTISPASWP